MLLHPPVQGHVVILGPAAEWVQEEDGVLVASLQQAALGVLHQQGVTVVDGVAQLECKHGIWRGHGALDMMTSFTAGTEPQRIRPSLRVQFEKKKTCRNYTSGTANMLIFTFKLEWTLIHFKIKVLLISIKYVS